MKLIGRLCFIITALRVVEETVFNAFIDNQANTQNNDNVIITSKRHNNVVLM